MSKFSWRRFGLCAVTAPATLLMMVMLATQFWPSMTYAALIVAHVSTIVLCLGVIAFCVRRIANRPRSRWNMPMLLVMYAFMMTPVGLALGHLCDGMPQQTIALGVAKGAAMGAPLIIVASLVLIRQRKKPAKQAVLQLV